MPDFKTPALKRENLFGKIAEASKEGHSIQNIYFDQKDELRASFKIVEDNLKIVFKNEDVRKFKNINVEQINASLKDERERKDFKSSYEIIQRYLNSQQLEKGINVSPTCTAYWGPRNNEHRTSQRYNAYVHFYFKLSDFSGIGNDFGERLKTVSGNYISINDLADLFADGSEKILPHKQEGVKKTGNNKKGDHLPTKSDCEMAIEALINSGKDGFGKEEVFDWLSSYFSKNSIALKENWRIITQRNFEIWFGN
jgi:hypothetical protein